MDYVYEANYGMYILEQMSEQQKVERYIRECIILSEGTDIVNRLNVLNEGIGDTLSEWWEKFKTFVNKVWGKFLENFARLANSDKGYAEKYKDIILKKPLKEEHFPITMRDCHVGTSNIVNKLVPEFSPNLLDMIKTEEGADNMAFKKRLLDAYDGKTEFVDFAKSYFIGSVEEKSFEAHAINMTDLYNFVVTFDKVKTNIQNDLNRLMKSVDSIQKSMKAEIDTAPKPASTSTNTQQINTDADKNKDTSVDTGKEARNKAKEDRYKTKMAAYKADTNPNKGDPPQMENLESVFLFDKSKAYSVVYEQYISEVGTADKTASGSSAGTANPATTLKTATQNNVDKAHDTSTDVKRKEQLGNENAKSIEEKGKIYSTLCNNFLTAKMSAADFIKKEYMTIIKMHVNDYIGDSKTADTGVRSATDHTAASTVPKLTDADKIASVNGAIANAEAHKKEDADKEALKRAAVIALRNASDGKFTGDYEAAKSFMANNK